ncbi:hypothetical protein H0H93_010243 [Arthromyces matolae]|nr:hypothetical protein H0H93_010243 [Arthromyces matolae]
MNLNPDQQFIFPSPNSLRPPSGYPTALSQPRQSNASRQWAGEPGSSPSFAIAPQNATISGSGFLSGSAGTSAVGLHRTPQRSRQNNPTLGPEIYHSPHDVPMVATVIPGLPPVPGASFQGPSGISARSDIFASQTTGNPLGPLFVDTLASQLGLGDEDKPFRRNLHGFIKMGTGLSKADLATRTYMLAYQYITLKNVNRLLSQNLSQTQNILSSFNDVSARLEDNWCLTKDQECTLRIVVQDHLFSPHCINFTLMHVDVEVTFSILSNISTVFDHEYQKTLRANQADYHLAASLKNPNRERVLLTSLKTQCRISKNAFREAIRDSVFGDNVLTLDDFCWAAAARFKRAGASGVTLHERARLAILRRFTYENQHLVNVQDEERSTTPRSSTPGPSRPETPQIGTPDQQPRSLKRKRENFAGGRPQKGHDYWSVVDSWFRAQMKDRGANWDTLQWQEYINTTYDWDAAHFASEETEPVFMVTNRPVPVSAGVPVINGADDDIGGLQDEMDSILAAM